MSVDLLRPIRLVRLSRYGAIGETTSKFDYGLRATLVECGIAEWSTEKPETIPPRKQKKEIHNAS